MVDFLRSRAVAALDSVVVSNPQADHIGGFLDVYDAFDVSAVYLSDGTKRPLPLVLSCVVLATRTRRWSSLTEMRTEWGDARADVIAPLTDRLFSETKGNSVGILLTYGSTCLLLAGDAEKKTEEYMANAPTPAH